MSTVAALQRGRTAFRSHDWAEAYGQPSAADRIARVASEDLELLATSAYMIGADEVSIDTWGRAYSEWLREQNASRAVRCTFVAAAWQPWVKDGALTYSRPMLVATGRK